MFSFEDLLGGAFGGGGGHFHGHGHAADSDDEEASESTRFYEVIGVEKDASDADIKKAYRKKCRTLHPDRHPEEKEKYRALFQELQEAYDVLKDPETREIYDKHGQKAAKSKVGSDMSRKKSKRKDASGLKKSPAISGVLDCTLTDVYKGTTKTVEISRRIADDSSAKCDRCDGQGVVMMVQRMGPMMFQTQQKCRACGGVGFSLKTVEAEVQVNIPIGAKHGETVVVEGEGHRYPELAAGPVNVQLRIDKDPVFTRQGADLGMSYTISLRQAMLGFEIRVKHVSKSHLLVKSPEGVVVQPGALMVVHTYGMPQRYNPHVKGHLYIAMEVELPLGLDHRLITRMRKALPAQEGRNPDLKELIGDDEDKKETGAMPATSAGSKKKSKKKRRPKRKKHVKKNNKVPPSAMEVDSEGDEDYEEEVTCHLVEEGKIRATPAAARGYDDDEGGQGVECRQM